LRLFLVVVILVVLVLVLLVLVLAVLIVAVLVVVVLVVVVLVVVVFVVIVIVVVVCRYCKLPRREHASRRLRETTAQRPGVLVVVVVFHCERHCSCGWCHCC
jgi:membrane protein implicated in regulation of membrane protease activity